MFKNLLPSPPKPNPFCVWITGPTGVGKTRASVLFSEKIVGNEEYWISNGTLKWFDGYIGQQVAILDDFRTQDCKFNQLLRLLDRYPYRTEVKGGFQDWIPKMILITAPRGPREMWSLRRDEDLRQLERRIHHHLEFNEDANYRDIFKTLRNRFATRFRGEELPATPEQSMETRSSSSSSEQSEVSEPSVGSAALQSYHCTGNSDLDDESTISFDDENGTEESEPPVLERTNRCLDLTCFEQLYGPDIWNPSDNEETARSKQFY